ncbi:3-oxo-tetronate kinase [Pikeienuella sp. HZG-20]|uniref:3-oxo-tetronate kinase n=1 Tax=Paludibacillus litoralis TaxID=3133267 RepID=UPI0030EEC051
MLLGCVGDDFTGSSDLANTLAKGGMRVTQYAGVPAGPAAPGVEAGVVALKSRTIPRDEAVRLSLMALEWLAAQGCRQFFFKYCSTFDSTPEGNIGPVAEAMAEALGADRVIVCPAFPATGRSIYQGHLFVGDKLLSESGMEHHPLTPMTDSDLRRWLRPQTRLGVGHVAAPAVAAGPAAIRAALAAEDEAGRRLIVVDAVRDEDLMAIGAAAEDLKLITGGSGVALGLPENFRRAGLLAGGGADWRGAAGPAAILSGSCSAATRGQVAAYRGPKLEIAAAGVMAGEITGASVAAWALSAKEGAPLAYSSADPAVVKAAQELYGREAVAAAIERVMGEAAAAMVAGGVRRLVVAGGETSGAVVEALDVAALEIGPEIDPGVPALKAEGRDLALALKSGNFGAEDFFSRALEALGPEAEA